MAQIYVCGRCSYRAHHKVICHNCRIHLEPECENCHNAQGNCICLYHGRPEHKIRKIKKDLKKSKIKKGHRVKTKSKKSKRKKR